MLVEFWDFCRPSLLRTLPYVKAWHERYAADGLRVVTVHCPGFAPGEDEDAVRAAVERLAIEHPVCIDLRFELWRAYDNAGWPARYLWNGDGHLAEYHYGEGGYTDIRSSRSRSCSASSASRSRRCTPRTSPAR